MNKKIYLWLKFNIFRPNASIKSQSLNNTQMTDSFNNLSHWCLHKVQEYEKRKNMAGALVRNGLNTLCLECFWKSNYRKTRWNQGQCSSHCLILNLKISNDLLLFMALGTKDHVLGAVKWFLFRNSLFLDFYYKVHCVT